MTIFYYKFVFVQSKTEMLKKIILLFFIPLLMLYSGCSSNQESKIIGVWELTRMDALPGEYPLEQWEFTADNDILKYEVTEMKEIFFRLEDGE